MRSWFGGLGRRFNALGRKGALEREMDDEMRMHIELEAEDLARAHGLTADEARRRAHIAFGGVERFKEEARDVRGARWLEDFGADLRYGIRGLRRAPGFAAAAALTLALGIGVTTALFSVVEAVLLQPLPFGDPARTVVIWSSWKDFPKTWVSYDEYEVYRDEPHLFAGIALFADYPAAVTGTGEPERVRAAQVSLDIFRVLGVSPMLGRGFLREEDAPGGPNVAIIGHALWQRRFASDPSAIGGTIEIGAQPFRIVGVLPPEFRLPLDYGANGPTEVLTPLAAQPDQLGAIAGPPLQFGGGSHGLYAVATLAPAMTVELANRTLRAIADRNTASGVYPPTWHFRSTAIPLREQISGSMRPVLFVLLGAVTVVLLIACANVAGLLLVRSDRRRRETTLRAVLGAGRHRLARQFLTEGLTLALAGGALGIAVAWLGVMATRLWAPLSLPLVRDVSLNARVLGFALATTLATVALFALAPALAATRVDLTDASKDGGRGATTGRGRLRARQVLVTAEIALAVALIVAGGLMIRTVQRILSIDPGFRSEGVLTMEVSVPSVRYPDDARVSTFYGDLRRRIAALPGVKAVGAARQLPLAKEIGDWGLAVEGYTPPPNEGTPGDWQVVTPGYFEAMRLRLIEGRFFDERDDAKGPPAIIVSRRLAEKYFAGRGPLGGRIRIGGQSSPWTTVVGVVEDVEHNALTGERKPTFYAPHAQFHLCCFTPRTMSLTVLTSGDATALAPAVRAQVRALDPQIPLANVRLMDDIVRGSVATQRFGMMLLAAFAALALLLAMVGIYAIVAQVVAARMREFGIRSALGATPHSLVRLSLANGARHAAVGLALGALAAFAVTRLLSGLLYGVAPHDPATFAAAIGATGIAALAACWIPARRAGRADPAAALHAE
jgi:putative ABC transport system permease protein